MRGFLDRQDFAEQLAEWLVEVSDVHIHGIIHERSIDRFAFEREHLMVTAGQPGFRLEALASRAQEMSYADFLDCVLTAAEASNDVHDV